MRNANVLGGLTASLLIAPSAAFAQGTSSLRFEAVTIKHAENFDMPTRPFWGRASWWNGQCTGGPGTNNPGILKCKTVSFANLVGQAYRLGPLQFVAQPWMESTSFKIEARVPAGGNQEQLRLMEQNLLAERFKLAVHFAKAEMAAYEMTVSRSGPKFRPTLNPKLGDGGESTGGGGGGMIGRHSMDQLASLLSYYMDRPVVDATRVRLSPTARRPLRPFTISSGSSWNGRRARSTC